MEALIPKIDPEVVALMIKHDIPLLSPQKAIASRIPDNNVLRDFIKAIVPENRMRVYEGLVPYLSFKPKPYWWLMAGNGRKHRASKKR